MPEKKRISEMIESGVVTLITFRYRQIGWAWTRLVPLSAVPIIASQQDLAIVQRGFDGTSYGSLPRRVSVKTFVVAFEAMPVCGKIQQQHQFAADMLVFVGTRRLGGYIRQR